MSEDSNSKAISRRSLFSALGLVVASSVAVPLAVTNAEARVGNPASAVSVAGVNRRDRRRDRRTTYKKKQ